MSQGQLPAADSEAPGGAGSALPEEEARKALADIVAGRLMEVLLLPGSAGRDRYGRLVGHAYADPGDGSGRVWVQEALVRSGHAVAYALEPQPRDCMARLLTSERAAESANAGLWGSGASSGGPVAAAWRSRELRAREGEFLLVAGRVRSVRSSRGRIYINFGKGRRGDFSAVLDEALAARFPGGAAGLERLEGREVEVRGFVEVGRGPFVRITDDSQLIERESRRNPGDDAGGRPAGAADRP